MTDDAVDQRREGGNTTADCETCGRQMTAVENTNERLCVRCVTNELEPRDQWPAGMRNEEAEHEYVIGGDTYRITFHADGSRSVFNRSADERDRFVYMAGVEA